MAKAAELIDAGVIGTPYFAKANYWESTNNAFIEDINIHFNDGENWRFDREQVGGGCLIDGGTHWVRPLRKWLVIYKY